MEIKLKSCLVRSWRLGDADAIARHANNHKIWLNLRDAFPYPYTVQDAREFIKSLKDRTPETTFTIAVNGEAAGSVGFVLRHDVERVSAEIGYWLAEPFWGRGIATEALVAMTEYAMATHHLTRMYALPRSPWTIGGHPESQAEALVPRRVRVAQRAPRAVGVEEPAPTADHAFLAGRSAARIDVGRAAF